MIALHTKITPLTPPRLLHVFPTFKVGGAQMRLSQIANALGDRYTHHVLALDGAYDAAALIASDVPFQCLEDNTVVCHEGNLLQRLRAVRKVLCDLNPSLLITYNWGSIEWALANLIPLCPHVHIEDGFGPEEAEQQFKRRVWMRRITLSGHSHVVVPSKTLEHIALTVWHLPKTRLTYIPNGIDCARFALPPAPHIWDQWTIPTDRPLIGTLTALRAEKNLPRLIKAFAAIIQKTPAHLIIMGDGPERPRLEQICSTHNLTHNVTFTGHISQPEQFLGALDVFAISSDTEQMPLSILEAMAAKLPIAGVDVGDIKVMVAEANKPLIVAPSTDQLADALHACLARKEERLAIGEENARHVITTYDEQTMIKRYNALLTGIYKK